MARPRSARRPRRELVRAIASEFARHKLLIYASAIAFRALVALIPLLLLAIALLGAFGLEDVWPDSIAPTVQDRVTPPVYTAIDFTVRKILESGTLGLIAFAGALALYDGMWGVRAVTDALNTIHDVRDDRPWWRRALVALVLAMACGSILVAVALLVIAAPRAAGGALGVVVAVGAWAAGAVLLGVAIGLLVRYAPAERPEIGWASVGSAVIVTVWVVASLLFGAYVAYLADFKTAAGSLVVLLVLNAYLFTSSIIFLAGVELDELARNASR